MATKPHYLRRAAAGILLTGAVFLLLPPALRLYDPTAGQFHVDTLNALGLAAVLFSGLIHLGLFAYEKIFPGFYTYQRESLEGEGKLFEPLTDKLEVGLDELANQPSHLIDSIGVQAERRKTAQFKFIIRCVRLAFCLLSLAYLLHLATAMVNTAMLAVPAGAPAL